MSPRADMKTPEIRVTFALGAAVLAQSALGLLWAGAAAERLDQLETRAEVASEIIVRTARLEEQTAAIRASLARIETKLDRAKEEGGR
jgi:hypothetical protein